MHPDDRELKADALEKKRIVWLQRHDQATCRLTNRLPSPVGLPVRITDNEDRDRQLYRGRGGEIHGWTEHPDATKIETSEGEWLMNLLPLLIYVYYAGATWTIGNLPKGVCPHVPKRRMGRQ